MMPVTARRTQVAHSFDSHHVATSSNSKISAPSHTARDSWAIQDIKNGIAEADARDFASPEEVKRVFAKYGC